MHYTIAVQFPVCFHTVLRFEYFGGILNSSRGCYVPLTGIKNQSVLLLFAKLKNAPPISEGHCFSYGTEGRIRTADLDYE